MAMGIEDPLVAVDLDLAVATWGKHVEHEMAEAARRLQDKWQAACDAKRDKAAGRKSKKSQPLKLPSPPTRAAYRAEGERVFQWLVRQVRVWGPWQATKADASDLFDALSGISYTIEKERDWLVGNPAIDENAWKGRRRLIWSDGRIEELE